MTINSNQVNSTRLEVELKFKLRCFIRAICDSHNLKCPTAVQTSGQIWNLLCFICCWKSRVMYLLHLLWLSMYSAMAMVGIPCDQCPHCSHLDMLILQILFSFHHRLLVSPDCFHRLWTVLVSIDWLMSYAFTYGWLLFFVVFFCQMM